MSEAEDRDEIRQLISTYTANGDRGRVEALAAAFAEDAAMTIPTWRAQGRAGIAKALRGVESADGPRSPVAGPRGRIMRHHLTSCHITFDGPDEATGRTYWINFTERGMDHSGLYADKFRRVDGGWKIVLRDVRIDWKAPNSRSGPEVLTGPRPADAPPLPLITGD